jgi:hypothetical protein
MLSRIESAIATRSFRPGLAPGHSGGLGHPGSATGRARLRGRGVRRSVPLCERGKADALYNARVVISWPFLLVSRRASPIPLWPPRRSPHRAPRGREPRRFVPPHYEDRATGEAHHALGDAAGH